MVQERSKLLLQEVKLGKSLVFIFVLNSFRNASASFCSGCRVESLLLPPVQRGWHEWGYNKLAAVL